MPNEPVVLRGTGMLNIPCLAQGKPIKLRMEALQIHDHRIQ